MAEQNAVITSPSNYDHIIPTYAVVDKKSQQQQQTQQMSAAPPPHHGQYVQYNTLIPVSKMNAFQAQHQQSSKVSQFLSQ